MNETKNIIIQFNRDKIESFKDKIESFSGDYSFLSNFYLCEVYYQGKLYRSSEHAYQAAKTDNKEDRDKFDNITSGEAKKLGRKLQVSEHFKRNKVGIMHEIVLNKFNRNTELLKKLLDTYPLYIQEGNYWGDKFWGVCLKTGEGKNYLGKILMDVRDAHLKALTYTYL